MEAVIFPKTEKEEIRKHALGLGGENPSDLLCTPHRLRHALESKMLQIPAKSKTVIGGKELTSSSENAGEGGKKAR